MSKALSLKLRDDLFLRLEKTRRATKTPRNTFINRALDFYTAYQERKDLRDRLRNESLMVRESSLEVLREMDQIEDGCNG